MFIRPNEILHPPGLLKPDASDEKIDLSARYTRTILWTLICIGTLIVFFTANQPATIILTGILAILALLLGELLLARAVRNWHKKHRAPK